MALSADLAYRGLIKDRTFDDITWLDTPRSFYLGIDCSADSLTVGNLAVLLLAKRLSAAGWQAVLLVGGATSLIGDPGGKTEERELKTKEEIDRNVAGIEKQLRQLFAAQSFQLVNNYDWAKDLMFLEFLRDVGKHYPMSDLMNREFIAERLGEGGSGISYAEFSYTLLQGYDFWHLFSQRHIVLQIGGSDQWGNMLSGVPLIRKRENQEAHAFSMPLIINKATGKKFGKSEEGAVWLDPARTSVYKFYQFWLNADDEGVQDYLKIFTELSREDIEAVMREFEHNKAGRAAQKRLAYEATRLVHGEEAAAAAKHSTEILFESGDYERLMPQELEKLAQEFPLLDFGAAAGRRLPEILEELGLASSLSDARRLLESKAIYLNGMQVAPNKENLAEEDLLDGHYAIIRRGKNNFAVIKKQ